MRRAVVLVMVVATLVPAAPAPAATPTDRKIAALQRQVKALQKEVKTLRTAVVANYAADACLAASVADVFQATWLTVDAFAFAQTKERIFQRIEPLGYARVNDRGACNAVRVPRASNETVSTATVFEAIARFFVS